MWQLETIETSGAPSVFGTGVTALVFDGDIDTKWQRALHSIGVNLSTLSGTAGRA